MRKLGWILTAALLATAAACAEPSADPDAGSEPPAPDAGRPPGDPPSRYPLGATHSPITPVVAKHLYRVALGGASVGEKANVFAKVGDSITVASTFLGCLAGSSVNLDGRTALQSSIGFFKQGDAGGTNPYQRVSLAASVGKTAGWAITGSPSPLDQESEAVRPRYAVVMYGTNDVGGTGAYIHTYAANLLTLVDEILAQGIIPILSTIPPRDDDAAIDAWVPRYNEIVRAVAQGRQIPLVDYHKELMPLPAHGLGADGVHPNTYYDGSYKPCVFTAAGLAYGYNVRNLLTLQALDRARLAAEQGTASDAAGAPLAGTGTSAAPFVVDALPFVDLADTSRSAQKSFDRYSCATQDESGPEMLYQVTLATASPLRATVYVRGTVDVDVHLLTAKSAGACLARNDREIYEPSLPAGTYWIAVDSYVPAGGMPRAGEYVLTIATQ